MNSIQMNDIQKVCKIDLERRQLYTTTEQAPNGMIFFPTSEGNVIAIARETTYTIDEYHEIMNAIPHCVLAIVSKDSSVVYYGIEPSHITFTSGSNE